MPTKMAQIVPKKSQEGYDTSSVTRWQFFYHYLAIYNNKD